MLESVKLAPLSCVLAGKVPVLAGIVFARTDFGGSVRPFKIIDQLGFWDNSDGSQYVSLVTIERRQGIPAAHD
jgi:hypothetical protein